MISASYLVQAGRLLCVLVFAVSLLCQSSAASAQLSADTFSSSFIMQQATASAEATYLEMIGYLPGTVWQVVANQRLAVALTSGDLIIVDIRNLAHPRIMSRLLLRTLPTGAGNGQTTLALVDNYLFLSCADHCGDTSLFVINIAVPTTPVVVGKLKTGTTLSSITIHGDRLYGSLNGEFAIIDIDEPSAPKVLGVQPLRGQFAYATDAVIWETAKGARYAFVTSLSGKLSIVDVTTPTAPQEVAIYAPDQACMNDVALMIDGNQPHLYLTDCHVGLRVLDLTNPVQPQAMASYSFGEGQRAYAITAIEQRLFVTTDVEATSAWDSTLHLLDATGSTLHEIGSFNNLMYIYDMADLGQILLLADHSRGIQFLDFTEPAMIHEVGRQVTTNASDLDSDGHYLYAVDPDGLKVIDPQNPIPSSYLAEIATPYALTIDVDAGFALITDYEGGLSLFDVQNPAQPTLISRSSTPLLLATEVVVSGTLGAQAIAFLSGLGCNMFNCPPSLVAVDLTNQQQPTVSILQSGERGIVDMVQGGKFLYLATGNLFNSNADLAILDIEQPIHPSAVGQISLPAPARSMALAGQALYIALDNALQTYDLANPMAPRLTHTLPLSRGFASITVNNGFLYGKDGFDLTVLSLDAPLQPTVLERQALPSEGASIASANSIFAVPGYVYVLNASLTTWREQRGLRGHVLDVWGEPQTRAAIYAWSEGNTITNTLTPVTYAGILGQYGLPVTMTGSYSVQAAVEGYHVWPSTYTGITHDTAEAKDFYLLTQPVSVTVQPGTPATLAYVDGRNLQTEGLIAAGTVSQPSVVTLTPIMAFDQMDLHFTGNAFALALADGASGAPLDALAQPITLTVHYSDQGHNAALDERSFQLMIEVADVWQAIPATPAAAPVIRDLGNNAITVALPKPGRYALFGTTNRFYLPLFVQK